MGCDRVCDAVLVDADSHVALLFVGAGEHGGVLVGRKGDEAAWVGAGVDGVDQFEVREVVNIDAVL